MDLIFKVCFESVRFFVRKEKGECVCVCVAYLPAIITMNNKLRKWGAGVATPLEENVSQVVHNLEVNENEKALEGLYLVKAKEVSLSLNSTPNERTLRPAFLHKC